MRSLSKRTRWTPVRSQCSESTDTAAQSGRDDIRAGHSRSCGHEQRHSNGDIDLGATTKPKLTQAQYDAGIAKGHSPAEIAQHYDVSGFKVKK
jgi:hypothetical protein